MSKKNSTDVIADIASRRAEDAAKTAKELDLTLRRAAIAFRVIYAAAAAGNVQCKLGIALMEKLK